MKNRTAYTLIELLLAMAVITSLTGLLLLELVKSSGPLPVAGPLDMQRGYDGVGIIFDNHDDSRAMQIAKVIPNSPAAAAKLSAGLVIQTIDGVPTRGKDLEECQTLIRGQAGTYVQLELVNIQRQETNTVELARQDLTR